MSNFEALVGRPLYSPTQKCLGTITAVRTDGLDLRAVTVAREIKIPRSATLADCLDGVTVQKATRPRKTPRSLTPQEKASADTIEPAPQQVNASQQIDIVFCDEDAPTVPNPLDTPVAPLCTPSRIVTNYAFLLGRTTTADITLGDNILRQGTLILANVVELVRSHGKLFELTVKSKTSSRL